MPQLKKKVNSRIHIDVIALLKEANSYIRQNLQFMLCIFVVNLVFMLIFKHLPQGISNPLVILWVICYYIFWCFFFRYYYHLQPYLLSKTIVGSLNPSSKALVLMLIVTLFIIFLPMLPLFLGFNDVYIDIYENYLKHLDGLSDNSSQSADLFTLFIVYSIMALLAPSLLCKPYMAWISSLRGTSPSFKKVGDRTKGNYWQFVAISALLLFPEALGAQIDKIYNLQNWLDYTVSTIVFVYTNILFAKLYDLFYIKN